MNHINKYTVLLSQVVRLEQKYCLYNDIIKINLCIIDLKFVLKRRTAFTSGTAEIKYLTSLSFVMKKSS